jgi:metallo-beta-lactamase class B
MNKNLLAFTTIAILLLTACKPSSTQPNKTTTHADTSVTDRTIVYQTDNLILQQLSPHVYQHISFLQTQTFGKVDCNGMIVVNEAEAIVFDTPATKESAEELIAFIVEKLQSTITAIIPTHFHEDCVAALETFLTPDTQGYASHKTIALLNGLNKTYSKPLISFQDSLALTVGSKTVHAQYFGEGHTRDNIIGYFPDDNALFGGCLVKAMGASKGNLEDANVSTWPATVRKVQQKYTDARIVIPGHGKPGTAELLTYTINLFEE